MKKILLVIYLSHCISAQTTMFLNKTYGQLHQSAARTSRILTTFECAHPLKVKSKEGEFSLASYANYTGYILTTHLVENKPKDCFQDLYRKYFELLELGISEMHYFGKLQDSFIEGKVMP